MAPSRCCTIVSCSNHLIITRCNRAIAGNPGEKLRKFHEISITDFYNILEKLVKSTWEQRLTMKEMDYVRVDLIVPAVIFIEHHISETGITQIIQTDFALREGVLFEMMNK